MFHLIWCLKKSFFMFYRDIPKLNKRQVTRANHAPYVTKALRKAITKRTQLQHRYFNNRASENWNTYKHQALSGEVCNCTGMHSHTCKSVYSCDKLHMQMKLLTIRFYYIIACVWSRYVVLLYALKTFLPNSLL